MDVCEPTTMGRFILDKASMMVPSEYSLNNSHCENRRSEKVMEEFEVVSICEAETYCAGTEEKY